MECNITDEELEKRYDKVNISHEPMYYPFSEGQKAERVVVDLVHDNSSVYYVHIEFSPVGVFYTGDMGSFTFNGRLISQPKYFFSGSHINPHYWAEKVCAAHKNYYVHMVDEDKLDEEYREEIMDMVLSSYTDEAIEAAKEALQMGQAPFEQWCVDTAKEDDPDEDVSYAYLEEHGGDYIKDVIKLRNMEMPTMFLDRDTEESAYDAIISAMSDFNIPDDWETAGAIVDRAVEEDYLYLYACKVLQWVSNMIRKQESTNG